MTLFNTIIGNMEAFFTAQNFLDFFTLTTLEIVLGIDNVVFISILVHNLPADKRQQGRLIGLSLAFILRVLMLFGATWIMKLTVPLFSLFSLDFSGRNILLIIGGLFLVGKSILEIIDLFSDKEFDHLNEANIKKTYLSAIVQIVFVDLILSFDSIITAVAMTDNLIIIIAAIFIAIAAMLVSSKPIGEFIYKYPSLKVIALCFIALVGVMLIFNGFECEFPKTYLYATLIFSMLVEIINISLLKKKNKVK